MLKKIYIILLLLFSLNSCSLGANQDEVNSKIRNGEIHMEDIAGIIRDFIDYFIAIAGTISVIFIIIGAYQMLFGSVDSSGSDSKGKETVTAAIIGFAISALSWFIVKLIFDNLS